MVSSGPQVPGDPGRSLPVAVVQHDVVWEDRAANLDRLRGLIASAAGGGSRLVVLTEMFSTGFSPEVARISEPAGGPAAQFLVEQSRLHGIWLVGSICAEVPGSELPANLAVLTSPQGAVHHYAKRHLFSYAGEDARVAPGSGTLTVDIEGIRTTVFICYDLRFADDFWDLAPHTDAYVVVANWPASRIAHWRTLLVARAIENQAWVIGSNRVGEGGGVAYSGDSLIVDPLGEVVADGSGGCEQVLGASISPDRVFEVRTRYPFLADRG